MTKNEVTMMHVRYHETTNRNYVAEAIGHLRDGDTEQAVGIAKMVVETHQLFGLLEHDNPAVLIPLVETAVAICAGDLATAEGRYAAVPPVSA